MYADMDPNSQVDGQSDELRSDQSPSGTVEASPRADEANSEDSHISPFPTADELLATLRKRQQAAGRAGGLSRSLAKREATKRNIAKARLSRWPGREEAARGREQTQERPMPQGSEEES